MYNKIRVFIFDLGGVVVPENGDVINRVMAEHLGLDPAVFRALTFDLRSRATIGKATLLDLYSELVKKIKSAATPRELVEKHLDLYQSTCTKEDREILELIEKFKQKYTVVCLANTEHEVAKLNQESGLFDHFHKAYLSTELGLMKPQKEIYQKVLNDLKCRADETIFIDDRFENAKAAGDLGMKAIVYENVDQLKILLYS